MPNVKVDVNAVGFETNNTALDANAKVNKIVLKESEQGLSEVVVVGNATKKKESLSAARQFSKSSAEQIRFINVVPLKGWNGFNRYITDSLSTNPYYNNYLKSKALHLVFDLDNAGKAINVVSKYPVADSVLQNAGKLLWSFPPVKKIKKSKNAEVIMQLP